MGKLIRHIPKGVKHSFWGVLDAAIYPMIYMAMVPILMKGLGPVAFGLWVVLNTLMTTMQLFNLNIGLTAMRHVSSEAANGNEQKINRLINTLLLITALLVAIVLCIGVLLVLIIPRFDFLGLKELTARDISICLLMSALIAGIKFFDQVFQSILKAYEYFRQAAILNMINRIGLLAVNIFLAVQHATVIDLLKANVIFTVVYLALQFMVIRHKLPFIRLYLRGNKTIFRSLLHFSMWPWMQSIIVTLAFQTDRFWVASTAGLKEVSAYGLVATMFNHIHMIFVAMATWMLPRISGMVARGDDPGTIYYQVRNILTSVVMISLLCFYFASPLLFRIWVGDATYQSMAVYIKAFIIFELLFMHTIMPFFYLNASGNERLATWITLGYSAGCYVLMIAALLIMKHPVYLIHGMSISLCISMPLINKIIGRRIGINSSSIGEMLPAYLAILLIYSPYLWLQLILLPALFLLFYHYYLAEIIAQKKWKQPVRI